MSVRHDWYQSDSAVVITVLLKNASEKNYAVKIEREKVTMTADNYHLELNLYRPIVPERSTYKATASKVEISLAKDTGERWEKLDKPTLPATAPNLEAEKDAQRQEPLTGSGTVSTPLKFSSHDWDKLANEIAKEDADEAAGEEALQNLFKKIYNDSSEEVRRAMNKSFMESGGTVLSTNWKEVGEKKVDIKPPDGTEYKEWNS